MGGAWGMVWRVYIAASLASTLAQPQSHAPTPCGMVLRTLDRLKAAIGVKGKSLSEPRKLCSEVSAFEAGDEVGAFLWLNHGQFMAIPGTVMELGLGNPSPSVLQRCLDWNWTRCDTYDANSDDPILAPRIDALVVTNDGFGNQQLGTVLWQFKTIDVIIVSTFVPVSVLVGAGYKEINHASNRMFSVWSRPGFLLGIEREMGLGNVIQVVAGSDGSGLMCPVYTPRPQEVYPRSHKSNTGTGCPLTECTRHIPSLDLESAVSGAFAEPHCSSWFGGGKKYSLRWAGEGNSTARAAFMVHFSYPVWLLNHAPICKLVDGRIGTLLPSAAAGSRGDSGPLHCAVLTPEGREVYDEYQRLLLDVLWPTAALNRIAPGELPLARDQGASTRTLAARVLALIDAHLNSEDRNMVARASGQPFRAVLDALAASTRTELTGFLSNKKWARHHGNSQGVHLARALLAERMLDTRRRALGASDPRLNPASNQDVATFAKNGFVILNLHAAQPNETVTHGRRQRTFRGIGNISPAMHSRILAILQFAAGDNTVVRAGWRFKPVHVVHAVHDIQTVLHSDSFASTIKVFAFAQPVSMADGPFNYANQSHRHSEGKLRLLQGLVSSDEFWACQSPRLYSDMQRQHGYYATPLEVPANTMIIADTNGFHHRGRAHPGTRRDYSTVFFPGLAWSKRDVPRLNPFRDL